MTFVLRKECLFHGYKGHQLLRLCRGEPGYEATMLFHVHVHCTCMCRLYYTHRLMKSRSHHTCDKMYTYIQLYIYISHQPVHKPVMLKYMYPLFYIAPHSLICVSVHVQCTLYHYHVNTLYMYLYMFAYLHMCSIDPISCAHVHVLYCLIQPTTTELPR